MAKHKKTNHQNSNDRPASSSNFKQNPFKKQNNFNKNRNNKFKQNIKNFSDISEHSNLPDATPWSELKQNLEINTKQKDNHHNKTFDEKIREQFSKQKDENYRKYLIQEKQKTKPKWETFSTTTEEKPKIQNLNVIKNNNIKKNDDSSQMDFKESNMYRKAITKLTCLSKGSSLKSAINDLKRQNSISKLKTAEKKK